MMIKAGLDEAVRQRDALEAEVQSLKTEIDVTCTAGWARAFVRRLLSS